MENIEVHIKFNCTFDKSVIDAVRLFCHFTINISVKDEYEHYWLLKNDKESDYCINRNVRSFNIKKYFYPLSLSFHKCTEIVDLREFLVDNVELNYCNCNEIYLPTTTKALTVIGYKDITVLNWNELKHVESILDENNTLNTPFSLLDKENTMIYSESDSDDNSITNRIDDYNKNKYLALYVLMSFTTLFIFTVCSLITLFSSVENTFKWTYGLLIVYYHLLLVITIVMKIDKENKVKKDTFITVINCIIITYSQGFLYLLYLQSITSNHYMFMLTSQSICVNYYLLCWVVVERSFKKPKHMITKYVSYFLKLNHLSALHRPCKIIISAHHSCLWTLNISTPLVVLFSFRSFIELIHYQSRYIRVISIIELVLTSFCQIIIAIVSMQWFVTKCRRIMKRLL